LLVAAAQYLIKLGANHLSHAGLGELSASLRMILS
jgi:hypothetical protein